MELYQKCYGDRICRRKNTKKISSNTIRPVMIHQHCCVFCYSIKRCVVLAEGGANSHFIESGKLMLCDKIFIILSPPFKVVSLFEIIFVSHQCLRWIEWDYYEKEVGMPP